MIVYESPATFARPKTRRTVSRLDQLIGSAYEVRSFVDLTRPYQMAIAHYMAVDGEAWELLLPGKVTWRTPAKVVEALGKALPEYVRLYGERRFGVASLPVALVKDAVLKDPVLIESGAAASGSLWASKPGEGDIPDHPKTNRWPVILSSTDDETLQDGWHRLHCYIAQGARVIPAIFYPSRRHCNRGAATGGTQ